MRTRQRRARRFGLAAAAFGVAMTALLTLGSGSAGAVDPGYRDIGDTTSSTHSLTNVVITNKLNCQELHFGDTSNEWFPPGEFTEGNCGVHVALTQGFPTPTTTHYGPPCASACTGNTISTSWTAWTAVTQGDISHPAPDTNQVVTVAQSADAHLRLTETDTYHLGDEKYSTSVTLEQIGGDFINGLSGQFYIGGDCFLGGDDKGFGYTTGGVFCRGAVNNTTPSPRLEGFSPVTPGSHYIEAEYADVWDAILSGNQLPDTCICNIHEDNGAALSWAFAIRGVSTVRPAAEPAASVPLSSATFSWNTVAQPLALATPTATVAPTTAPSLPPTGAQSSPTAPAPAPAAPWLWIGIAAVIGIGGFGLVRKLPRRDI